MPELALVRERDGDRCARCGSPNDLHVHHRVRRAQGGRDAWVNLITLCATCHEWAHRNPDEARHGGWLLQSWEDPAQAEIDHWLWPAGPVFLEDDGGIRLLLAHSPPFRDTLRDMTEKVRRDFTAELDKIIDDLVGDGPWTASVVADQLIKQLRDTDPELLAGWLDTHAHGLLARHITGRANLERRHAHRDAVQARVRGDFAAGGERLTVYRSWHVVSDDLLRKRACEMTGREHHYVASQYRTSSRRTAMLARFHEAIAKKCGPDGVTADFFTEQQYTEMLQSLGVTA